MHVIPTIYKHVFTPKMKLKFRIAALIPFIALFSATAYSQNRCEDTIVKVDVSANRLDLAIAELSSQIACPISYDKKFSKRFRSGTVKGMLKPSDALIKLITGTGLEVHNENNQLVINKMDQQATILKATSLQTDLNKAVKSQKVSSKIANEMYTELGDIKTSVTEFAKSQGFVSAGEKASYQRTFEKAQQVLTRRE